MDGGRGSGHGWCGVLGMISLFHYMMGINRLGRGGEGGGGGGGEGGGGK